MLNHVCVMGRIGTDIDLRRTGNNVAVASFALAVDRDFKSGGEKETDWFDIVAWRNTAEFIQKYFAKGKQIVISGRLQARSWTDKEGNKRKTVEIVADNAYFAESKNSSAPAQNFAPIEEADEGLPF